MNSTISTVQDRAGARFVTTLWSAVLTAGHSDSASGHDALAGLCQAYWYPLYAYVRHRGYSPADAEDLTQGFFAHLLTRKPLRDIRREGGKFRSFLLAALNHFLVDEWRKARVEKRGGGNVISLDAHQAETRFGREPVDTLTPERLFEQNWALAVLETVYARLESEYKTSGKAGQFEALRFCLTGERSAVPYARLAAQLGMPENTVKTLVHRLRGRYRELLREEVAQGLPGTAEVEEELKCLFRALAGN